MPTEGVDLLYHWLRPLLFRLSPHAAHRLAMGALGLPEQVAPVRRLLARAFRVQDPALEVLAMGLRFPNPVGVAGGLDKDGRCPHALAALGFGHVELGTVTAEAQEANPLPNLFRLPDDEALINRLGFPNKGAPALAARLASRFASGRPEVPVGVSIGKSRRVPIEDEKAVIDDYLASFRAVRGVADFVVVNVSSPNTKDLRAMQRAGAAGALLGALLEERSRGAFVPLLLKVAPDLDSEDYEALLGVVADLALDGLIATNTTTRREGLRTPPARLAEIGPGGLSGPPLRLRSRAMVQRARERLGPRPCIIGVGGVRTPEDVTAMLGAGANLVQLYTSFIYEGPGLPARLARGLQRARG
jgi:dihydroorotate dehydrogenase